MHSTHDKLNNTTDVYLCAKYMHIVDKSDSNHIRKVDIL